VNTNNLIPAAEDMQKDWLRRRRIVLPVLELAAREVFETMLASRLTSPITEPSGSLSVTATGRLAGMLCGGLKVRCQHAAALMASKRLGVEVDEVGPYI
jgi:hypothetical protein